MHFRVLYISSSLSLSPTLKKVLAVAYRGITTTTSNWADSSSSSSQSYYEVLGVKSNCSQKEIRAAYLELCKKHHPDKQQQVIIKDDDHQQQQTCSSDDNNAAAAAATSKARFQRINEAYDCLSRERERTRYDLDLQSGSTTTSDGFYQNPQAYYRRRGYPRGYAHQAQYYDNFTRMHYGYRYRPPTDGQVRDVQLFGTSFAVFIITSLIIASILQIRVYIVYRDWNRRNLNSNGATSSYSKEQIKSSLYKDNSVRSKNKHLFWEIDKQEGEGGLASQTSSLDGK